MITFSFVRCFFIFMVLRYYEPRMGVVGRLFITCFVLSLFFPLIKRDEVSISSLWFCLASGSSFLLVVFPCRRPGYRLEQKLCIFNGLLLYIR